MDVLVRELKAMQRRLGKLENQHSPTVPIMDPDFPTDAVPGQFALATEPPEDAGRPTMLPYYRDKVGWHPLTASLAGGGVFKWISIEGTTTVIAESPTFPEPFTFAQPGYDDTIFGAALSPLESHTGIRILQPGLYLCRTQMGWATDKGLAGIELGPTIISGPAGTGIAGEMLGFDGDGPDKSSWYYGEGSSLLPAAAVKLVSESMIKVHDPGDGILLRVEVARDPADADEPDIHFSQMAMRLSASDRADQT
jgi:hypothetical protein